MGADATVGSGVGPAAAAATLSRTTAAVKIRFVGLMAGRGAPAGLVYGVVQDERRTEAIWGREGDKGCHADCLLLHRARA